MASASVTAVEGVHGRPAGGPSDRVSHLPLVITIDSKDNSMHADIVMLCCFGCLYCLATWYQSNTAASGYMSLANVAILDKVIVLISQRVKSLFESSINEHALCSQLCLRRLNVPG